MQDYECRKRLEASRILLNGFPHHQSDLNQRSRVSAGGWSENLKQLRKHETVIDRQFSLLSNSNGKGLEEVKQHLLSSFEGVRIAALKEALKYGEEGFKLIAQIVKTENGLVQLTAYDLLWENANLRGRQKLLKYFSRHPQICANYIEKVLEPSLFTLQKEQEQRHQILVQICNNQELINPKNLALEANALEAQIYQQTNGVRNLLLDLVSLSKLFESKAKKYLFEAQIFANAIKEIEKIFLQMESKWQELESLMGCDKSTLKLLQILELLSSKMQEHLMLLRQTVARAVTNQLQMQHHYNLGKKAATYCKYRAELDWQEGNENWARESLVRRKTYLDTVTILNFSLEQQMPQLQAFKCYMFVLQSWLSLAQEMKNVIGDKSSFQWVQEARTLLCGRIEFPHNARSIMATLERIERESLGEQ
ncbi:MAG: hypothetical protein M3O33_05790 [Cyanobacteriota bacterium]|nr:hypothetical protein [Cyanobacteriota bacterium]